MPARAYLLRLMSLFLCALSGSFSYAQPVVHVRGSSTFMPFVQSVSEAYMAHTPNAAVVVSSGGSERGYKALLDGTADVAMVSGPMPDALQREFERRHIGLESTTIAYLPLVVAVHPGNSISNISVAQLRAVFSGKTNHWESISDREKGAVQVFVGPPTGGLTAIWKTLILRDDDTFTAAARVMPAAHRATLLANVPTGITFLALSSDKNNLKYLNVNGMSPTREHVINGVYPLRSELRLVTREKAPAHIRAFIKYFFTSNEKWDGEQLIFVAPN